MRVRLATAPLNASVRTAMSKNTANMNKHGNAKKSQLNLIQLLNLSNTERNRPPTTMLDIFGYNLTGPMSNINTPYVMKEFDWQPVNFRASDDCTESLCNIALIFRFKYHKLSVKHDSSVAWYRIIPLPGVVMLFIRGWATCGCWQEWPLKITVFGDDVVFTVNEIEYDFRFEEGDYFTVLTAKNNLQVVKGYVNTTFDKDRFIFTQGYTMYSGSPNKYKRHMNPMAYRTDLPFRNIVYPFDQEFTEPTDMFIDYNEKRIESSETICRQVVLPYLKENQYVGFDVQDKTTGLVIKITVGKYGDVGIVGDDNKHKSAKDVTDEEKTLINSMRIYVLDTWYKIIDLHLVADENQEPREGPKDGGMGGFNPYGNGQYDRKEDFYTAQMRRSKQKRYLKYKRNFDKANSDHLFKRTFDCEVLSFANHLASHGYTPNMLKQVRPDLIDQCLRLYINGFGLLNLYKVYRIQIKDTAIFGDGCSIKLVSPVTCPQKGNRQRKLIVKGYRDFIAKQYGVALDQFKSQGLRDHVVRWIHKYNPMNWLRIKKQQVVDAATAAKNAAIQSTVVTATSALLQSAWQNAKDLVKNAFNYALDVVQRPITWMIFSTILFAIFGFKGVFANRTAIEGFCTYYVIADKNWQIETRPVDVELNEESEIGVGDSNQFVSQGDDDTYSSSLSSWLADMMTSITAFSVTESFGRLAKSARSEIRDFAKLAVDLRNLGLFFNSCYELMKKVIDYVYEKVTGVPFFSSSVQAKEMVKLYTDFVATYYNVTDQDMKNNVDVAKKYVNDFTELRNSYQRCMTFMSESTKSRVQQILSSCLPRVQTAFQYIATSKGRPQPVVLFLSGTTAVGKTTLVKVLIKALNNAIHHVDPTDNDIYYRNQKEEFWSGYHGQRYCVYDDFLQSTDPTDRARAANEMIHVANTSTYPLNMPDLLSKGLTFFESPFVIVTSNLLHKSSFTNIGLTEPDALLRRFDLFCKVELKNSARSEGQAINDDMVKNWLLTAGTWNYTTQNYVFQAQSDIYNLFNLVFFKYYQHQKAHTSGFNFDIDMTKFAKPEQPVPFMADPITTLAQVKEDLSNSVNSVVDRFKSKAKSVANRFENMQPVKVWHDTNSSAQVHLATDVDQVHLTSDPGNILTVSTSQGIVGSAFVSNGLSDYIKVPFKTCSHNSHNPWRCGLHDISDTSNMFVANVLESFNKAPVDTIDQIGNRISSLWSNKPVERTKVKPLCYHEVADIFWNIVEKLDKTSQKVCRTWFTELYFRNDWTWTVTSDKQIVIMPVCHAGPLSYFDIQKRLLHKLFGVNDCWKDEFDDEWNTWSNLLESRSDVDNKVKFKAMVENLKLQLNDFNQAELTWLTSCVAPSNCRLDRPSRMIVSMYLFNTVNLCKTREEYKELLKVDDSGDALTERIGNYVYNELIRAKNSQSHAIISHILIKSGEAGGVKIWDGQPLDPSLMMLELVENRKKAYKVLGMVGIALIVVAALVSVFVVQMFQKQDDAFFNSQTTDKFQEKQKLRKKIVPKTNKYFTKKNFRSQAMDDGATSLAESIYRKNMFFAQFVHKGGHTTWGYLTFVHGSVAVTALHCVCRDSRDTELIKMYFDPTKPDEFVEVEVKQIIKHNDRDLAIIVVSAPIQFKDLTNHFMSHDEFPKDNVRGATRISTREGCLEFFTGGGMHLKNDIKTDMVNISRCLYVEDIIGESGDSGAPYLLANTKFQKKFIGIHLGANTYGSIVAPLYKEDFDFISSLDYVSQCCLGDIFVPKGTSVEVTESCGDEPLLYHEGIRLVGKTNVTFGMPIKTSLEPTAVYKGCTNPSTGVFLQPPYEKRELPARLGKFQNKDGMMIDPLILSMRKFKNKRVVKMPPFFRDKSSWAGVFTPGLSKHTLRMMTIEEVVFGSSSLGLPGIDISTSSAFPYIAEGIRRDKLIDKETRYIAPIVREAVEEWIAFALKGVIRPIPFLGCLKDELRPVARVELGYTRLFQIGSLVLLIISRMMFGAFMMAVETERDGDIQVGINPYSDDWKKNYDDLTKFGFYANIIDQDVDGWDINFYYGVAEEFCNQFCDHFGLSWNDDWIKLMYASLIASFNVYFVLGNKILWSIFMTSGSLVTSIFNTILNSVKNRVLFKIACYKALNKPLSFDEWVVAKLFGDDSNIAVHPDVLPIFNGVIIAQLAKIYFNHTHTDPNKGNDLPPGRRIEDVVFLQRKYVVDNGRVKCPLSEETLEGMVQWVHKNKDYSNDVAFKINAYNALDEWSLHGPAKFEKHKRILNAFLIARRQPVYNKTYDQVVDEMTYRQFAA
jgi:hypothetical protein